MMTQNRLDTSRQSILKHCGFIKVMLMLLIVLYHSILFWKGNWFPIEPAERNQLFSIVAVWLNSFHIYGFVAVSGFLFAYLKFEKNKYREFLPFLRNKWCRLIVPYLFAALLWVMPWYCFYFDTATTQVFLKFVLAQSPSQLWFLWMLFDVFVLIWPLSDVIRHKPLVGVLIALMFYAVGVVGRMILPDLFQIFTACRYVIFFVMGMLIETHAASLLRRIPKIPLLAADLAVFAVAQFLERGNSLIFKLLSLGTDLLLHLIGALMAFVLLDALAQKIRYEENRCFRFLEEHNFVIYLFHQQLIYGVLYLLNGQISSWVIAVINVVVSIVLPSLLALVLDRWSVTRFLVGKKNKS